MSEKVNRTGSASDTREREGAREREGEHLMLCVLLRCRHAKFGETTLNAKIPFTHIIVVVIPLTNVPKLRTCAKSLISTRRPISSRYY